MKKQQKLSPSRRDIQRLVSPGDAVIVTDNFIVLLLFWFEKDGDHFCAYLRTKEVKTFYSNTLNSSVQTAPWRKVIDWCYDWLMSLSAEIVHAED